MSHDEEVVHELARILASTDDRETIIRSILRAASSISKARSIEWFPEAGEGRLAACRSNPPGHELGNTQPWQAGVQHRTELGVIELVLGEVHRIEGRVRLVGSPAEVSRSPETAARLNTLRILAAAALRGIDRECKGEPESGTGRAVSSACRDDRIRLFSPAEDASDDDHGPIPILQDATFLNAVLPFALGLAKRHGESLALLCVAIDRLGGIRELMGRESADRAVDAVGRQVAAMIRGSDIVARIDDDRIIAVLPRAPLGHARRLAESVSRTVETLSARSARLPGLTVSIGIAEYPTCAATLYALLDAADHALAEAQRTGRNRVVSADPQAVSAPGGEARAYQSMTEPSSLS
jgi:diguanylate cyclase (GGDEF)-like protein